MKFDKFLPLLIEYACKSEVTHRHAAVLVYGGKAVSWGFNNISGNRTRHAEFDAIRKFLISREFGQYEKCLL